jgi:hypothetical protein
MSAAVYGRSQENASVRWPPWYDKQCVNISLHAIHPLRHPEQTEGVRPLKQQADE